MPIQYRGTAFGEFYFTASEIFSADAGQASIAGQLSFD